MRTGRVEERLTHIRNQMGEWLGSDNCRVLSFSTSSKDEVSKQGAKCPHQRTLASERYSELGRVCSLFTRGGGKHLAIKWLAGDG